MSSQSSRSQDFPSSPASAGDARRFTLRAIEEWSLEGAHADALVLIVSELATNAILHAVTPFRVTLRREGSVVRVEVSDGSPALPVVRHYAADATTGRGLALVTASSRHWGVTVASDGKIIWAEVPAPGVEVERERQPELGEARTTAARNPDARLVRFVAVPVHGYLALQAHNDEIYRDLELIRIEAEMAGPHAPVAPEVLEVIEPLTTQFGRARDNLRVGVERAYSVGLSAVDLEEEYPLSAAASALQYVSLLERVDELCRKGQILSTPASRPVAALRRWFAEEVERQLLRGEPPRAAPS